MAEIYWEIRKRVKEAHNKNRVWPKAVVLTNEELEKLKKEVENWKVSVERSGSFASTLGGFEEWPWEYVEGLKIYRADEVISGFREETIT